MYNVSNRNKDLLSENIEIDPDQNAKVLSFPPNIAAHL